MAATSPRDSAFWDVRRTIGRAARQPDVAATLQAIVDGVLEVVGFRVAAISRLRPDGDFEVNAVAGSVKAREVLVGQRWSREQMAAELARGEEWGLLYFVRGGEGITEVPYWFPDVDDDPDDVDRWRHDDALVAPLLDERGAVIGVLSVDLPDDGRLPDPARRRLLEDYALEASSALVNAEARAQLAERVRLADATRRIMQFATQDLSVERLVADCKPVLTDAFGADGVWLQTYIADEPGAFHITTEDLEVPETIDLLARGYAAVLWAEQSVIPVSLTSAAPPGVGEDDFAGVRDFMRELDIDSFLLVPIGAGPELLGHLAMSRLDPMQPWTTEEQAAGRDVGRDLGRVLLNLRLFAQEQESVAELERLHAYESRLIATVAHELKTPLTVLRAHLELLEDEPHPTASGQRSMETIARASARLRSLADDLLTLSRVTGSPEPGAPVAPASAVDLRRVVDDVLGFVGIEIARKHLSLVVVAPEDDEPVVAWGAREEYVRVCTNLVSNAVKYTPDGGRVEVTLERRTGEVALRVADDGIGISVEDQGRLFEEFFRSSNAEARSLPGSGLGLTIVRRIVERRGGRVTVASTPGEGSTFSATLPAPPG